MPIALFDLISERNAEAGTSLEDLKLAEELRRGSEEAYELLLLRFQQPVYNLALRLVGDVSDAADIVQEVFLKVFRNIGQFRGQSSLKTWVYRIAVNEAHNHRRWFSRHSRREVALENKEDASGRSYRDTLADPGETPYEVTLGTETRTMIEQELAGLKTVFRQAVVLRDIEELSYEEISEILNISIGTVKSRILRGREALRGRLQERLRKSQPAAWDTHGSQEVEMGRP